MDAQSFMDLLIWCQSNQSSCTYDYMKHRVVVKGGNLSYFENMTQLYGVNTAYVMTILASNVLVQDPSILGYIDQAKIIFEGVEYYIGFAKMGIRAIELNDTNLINYVLKQTLNKYERKKIIGTLMLSEWTNMKNRRSTVVPISQVMSLYHEFVNLYPSGTVIDGKYYPATLAQFNIYEDGLHGKNVMIGALPEKDKSAYVYGLIDRSGRHTKKVFDAMNAMTNLIQLRRFIRYIAMSGSSELMSRLAINPTLNDLINAVNGNNLDVVRWILNSQHATPVNQSRQDILESMGLDVNQTNMLAMSTVMDPTLMSSAATFLYPSTQEMVDLLRSYNLDISPINVTVGGLRLGNYEMLGYPAMINPGQIVELPYNDDVVNDIYRLAFKRAPGYLIQLYFYLYANSRAVEYLRQIYIENGDLYRLSLLN